MSNELIQQEIEIINIRIDLMQKSCALQIAKLEQRKAELEAQLQEQPQE